MNTEYKKKLKVCEKLGALKFQKVVFLVENIKYKTLKKLFPNFIDHYDKINDKRRDKKLKKVTLDEEKRKIIDLYRKEKLLVRREFNREQNRNYHIDNDKPIEFIKYLEWNKKIHKKGLIKNAITIPILVISTGLGYTLTIPLLAYELISAFVNFECVNIQNYNIYRIKVKEQVLKKYEERKLEENIEKYSEAAKVVRKTLDNTKDVPSLDEIVDNIENIEQLEQLRNLVTETAKLNQVIKESKTSRKKQANKTYTK